MNKTRSKSVIYSQVNFGSSKIPQIQGIETWAIDNEGYEYTVLTVELILVDETDFLNKVVNSYVEFIRAEIKILAKIKKVDIKKYSVIITLDEVDLS